MRATPTVNTAGKIFDSAQVLTFQSSRKNDSAARSIAMVNNQEEIDNLLNLSAALLESHPSLLAQDVAKKLQDLCIKIGTVSYTNT